MSNTARIAAQAANTLVKPLNIEEVFSTYLYTGTSTTNTINNGVDLSGEGGLLWIKNRDNAQKHVLFDTERGKTKMLQTNDTSDELTNAWLDSFNSNGFSIASGVSNAEINNSAYDYASWTFRKAPKFFDVVTYTGDGTTGRTISHNLGTTVGTIILKRTDSAANWVVFHRSLNYNSGNPYWLLLNLTNAESTSGGILSGWDDNSFTVTSSSFSNASGATYVAYLFAHNDGDGGFGPNGDADIIKCGSWDATGNNEIDLGFEPQWLLVKNTEGTNNWGVFDTMRGFTADGSIKSLKPNLSAVETSEATVIKPTATGFTWIPNVSGNTYIYIAIRRGPMAVPESATDVFETKLRTGTGSAASYDTSFPIDIMLHLWRNTGEHTIFDRMRGNRRTLGTRLTGAENTVYNDSDPQVDFVGQSTQTEINWPGQDWNNTNSTIALHFWKRAPSFFDVVAYTGNGSKQSVSHNLGVVPEMMWIKVRSTTQHWAVYHPDIPGSGKFLSLNNDWDGNNTNSNFWDGETPTATTFSVGASGVNNNYVNGSGNTYIAYLFASLAGVSKVGSYTGNGSTQTINCGFSSGARFVLVKRTDSTGDWYVWDTERGIVAANDPHMSLNTTAAEVTTDDSIDPVSSGFAVNQVAATNINVSSATYIFYAIA